MSTCRSCGADIVWAVTRGSEKPMPLDAMPDPDGNVAVGRDQAGHLLARVLATGDLPRPGEVLGRTHFATCPHAGQHRRPR